MTIATNRVPRVEKNRILGTALTAEPPGPPPCPRQGHVSCRRARPAPGRGGPHASGSSGTCDRNLPQAPWPRTPHRPGQTLPGLLLPRPPWRSRQTGTEDAGLTLPSPVCPSLYPSQVFLPRVLSASNPIFASVSWGPQTSTRGFTAWHVPAEETVSSKQSNGNCPEPGGEGKAQSRRVSVTAGSTALGRVACAWT